MTFIAKEHAKMIIQSLPDDILKELAFAKMIKKGLDDSINNRVISNDEMKQKIKQWQK